MSGLSPSVHANHHSKIAKLVEEARTAKDKKRASGLAASILRSHLGSGHGVRMLSGPPKTLAQLHELHVSFHRTEEAFPGSDVKREPKGNFASAQCPECERVFDLTNEDDADEFYNGHDCEVES